MSSVVSRRNYKVPSSFSTTLSRLISDFALLHQMLFAANVVIGDNSNHYKNHCCIHPKSERVCGFCFSRQKILRKKCANPHDKILRQKCINQSHSIIFEEKRHMAFIYALFQNDPGSHKSLLATETMAGYFHK